MPRLGKFAVTLVLAGGSLAACNTSMSPAAPTPVAQVAPVALADAPPTPTSQPGPKVGAQAIEGRIEAIGPPDTLLVAGVRIRMMPDAAFRSGGMVLSFSDLRVGARVRVLAEGDGASTLRGSLVDVLGS
ncbi:MAG: hypothetical protein ABI665_21900 [Vicinamibacterales bacterium]